MRGLRPHSRKGLSAHGPLNKTSWCADNPRMSTTNAEAVLQRWRTLCETSVRDTRSITQWASHAPSGLAEALCAHVSVAAGSGRSQDCVESVGEAF
jgi:hypothetical protein